MPTDNQANNNFGQPELMKQLAVINEFKQTQGHSISDMPTEQTELREKLAAIEHERWADWQKWCHQILRDQLLPSDELEIVLRRWDKQIETPYSQLSAKEKASDMEQVDRYWPLIEAYIVKEQDRIRAEVLDEVEQRLPKTPDFIFMGNWEDGQIKSAVSNVIEEVKSILASLRECKPNAK